MDKPIQKPNASSYNLIAGSEFTGTPTPRGGLRTFTHVTNIRHSDDGLISGPPDTARPSRAAVAAQPSNSSRNMSGILRSGNDGDHAMPAYTRPVSAHSARHAHSNGMRAAIDMTFNEPTPNSSRPATADIAGRPATGGASTGNGIRTYAYGNAASATNPLVTRPATARTASQFSPDNRAAGKATRRRLSRDDFSTLHSPLFDDAGQPIKLKFKKNHAMNSSQVFTAIAPDYTARADTPASARLTVHLANEPGAESSQIGTRDAASGHKSTSLAGSKKRTKETAQQHYATMVEPVFAPEGGVRVDKLGPGRGKKHAKGGRAVVKNSVEYNIIAPPAPAEETSASGSKTERKALSNTSGVNAQLENIVVPNVLEQQLKSKNVACLGVTGGISVNNFAKLCMGAAASEAELPKSGAVERRPPGYREASQFASNFMAVEPADAAAKSRAMAKAAAQAAAAADAAAQPTRTISSAPFGNDFNDSLDVKAHRSIGPKDVRDPITHAIRPAVLAKLASASTTTTKADDAPAAGLAATQVNSIWGFDETGALTARASSVPVRPVPFATTDDAAPSRPQTARATSASSKRVAAPVKAAASSSSGDSFASAFAAASTQNIQPLHRPISEVIADL